MKVTLERLPESRVQLDIEVDKERLDRSLDEAYKRLARKARIPGFRPGKAPRSIIERHYGREGMIREAIEDLVPRAYNEALEAEDIEAIDQPHLEILQLEPVQFKATVAVRPTIELNDYRSVRLDPPHMEVTDEMLAEQLLAIRKRYATQSPVERPAQWNDIITGSVLGEVDGEEFVKDEDAEFQLVEGRRMLVDGLGEAFPGMGKGEEKTIEIPLPDDFPVERFAGKAAKFTLSVREVKEEILPEEDDDFAQQVNADDFPTFEALRTRLRDNMDDALKKDAEIHYQQDVVDRILEGATVEFPRVLVDREIDRMISESSGYDRQAYVNHLARIGRSESEYREGLRPEAERHVQRSLVLSRLVEAEDLKVSAEAIDAEIESLVAPAGMDGDRLRELFASPEGRTRIERSLLTQLALARAAAIARGEFAGETPAEATPEAVDETSAAGAPAKKKRVRAKKEEPA
ncbi:MAG: trigger factor [Dehalococcoidia bacterium]|nr:trigger factor [Dehalococcoidia bacterium]MCL4231973.1 trigger factor [Dehalococcoidia bacterium]NUQ54759.1 trigger factor [Dehalococcoidia bacterium]